MQKQTIFLVYKNIVIIVLFLYSSCTKSFFKHFRDFILYICWLIIFDRLTKLEVGLIQYINKLLLDQAAVNILIFRDIYRIFYAIWGFPKGDIYNALLKCQYSFISICLRYFNKSLFYYMIWKIVVIAFFVGLFS